jgi:hypothetical protein
MQTPNLSFTPLEVDDRGGIVGALIQRRHALAWTGEDLDDRAGWADRYGAKLEVPQRPAGKLGFHFDFPCEFLPSGNVRPSGMATVWLHALGLRLVLVDEETARSIGAVPAPSVAKTACGGTVAPSHALKRISRGQASVMSAPAYETADRTLIAREMFRLSITDHPWLSARPELRARAEAIERDMAELQREIREAA